MKMDPLQYTYIQDSATGEYFAGLVPAVPDRRDDHGRPVLQERWVKDLALAGKWPTCVVDLLCFTLSRANLIKVPV